MYRSTEELAVEYSTLREAHEAAIAISATTHAGAGSHRRAHSPGLVAYLEKLSDGAVAEDQDPDARADRDVFARADIGPTQKQTLVNARRGQGEFRDRVIELEVRCRVTSIDLVDHLREPHQAMEDIVGSGEARWKQRLAVGTPY